MQLLSSTSTTTSITAMMIMRASLALLSVRPCTSKLDVETCPVWISKMVLAQHFGTVVWMHLHQCSVSHPTKIFLTSKFSYLLFLNPTHKTKTETANMWENTNSNLVDQSNYLANQQRRNPLLKCLLPTSAPCTEILSQTNNTIWFFFI